MKEKSNPLDALLDLHGGNVTHTANALGLARQQVQQWIRQGFIPWRKDLMIEEKTSGQVKAFDVREFAAHARRNQIT